MEFLILKSISLGFIEGVTEFIPVSSTAHLLLLGKTFTGFRPEFLKVFSVAIQSGAMIAVIIYFWKMVWNNLSLIPKILVAFIPTAIAGLLLKDIVSKLFDNTLTIAIALILGGVVLIFIKPIEKKEGAELISYKQALLIGLSQIAAFIPGVSRSGATLIGGTLLGIPRSYIAPFSFLLGVPTIFAASVLELRSLSSIEKPEWTLLAIGTIISFFVALLTMRFFLKLLTEKPLAWFGWYRILLGVFIIFVLLL